MDEQTKKLADKLVEALRAIPDDPPYDDDGYDGGYDFPEDRYRTRDEAARDVAGYILRKVGTWDAGGCPLCLG